MKESPARYCGPLLTAVAALFNPTSWVRGHSDELSPVTRPRKKRKRRSGPPPRQWNPYATSLYKFAKYALLMWAIATGIYLALKTSMDVALNQSSGGGAQTHSATEPATPNADALQEAHTTQSPQPPSLVKVQTIDDSVAYEVIAYAAKLWHALDRENALDLLLQRGSEVEALDVNGEWFHVRTEAGLTGFVHESMLRKR